MGEEDTIDLHIKMIKIDISARTQGTLPQP